MISGISSVGTTPRRDGPGVRACLQTVVVSHGATFPAVHRRGSLVLHPLSGDHRFRRGPIAFPACGGLPRGSPFLLVSTVRLSVPVCSFPAFTRPSVPTK